MSGAAGAEPAVFKRVVSRPLSVRIALGVVSAVFGFVIAVLVSAKVESLVVLVLGLLATSILTVRGFRVGLDAGENEIVVRNHFRT